MLSIHLSGSLPCLLEFHHIHAHIKIQQRLKWTPMQIFFFFFFAYLTPFQNSTLQFPGNMTSLNSDFSLFNSWRITCFAKDRRQSSLYHIPKYASSQKARGVMCLNSFHLSLCSQESQSYTAYGSIFDNSGFIHLTLSLTVYVRKVSFLSLRSSCS